MPNIRHDPLRDYLFEAILTRQMGILYCALFYTLLIPSLGHCSACEPDPHKD